MDYNTASREDRQEVLGLDPAAHGVDLSAAYAGPPSATFQVRTPMPAIDVVEGPPSVPWAPVSEPDFGARPDPRDVANWTDPPIPFVGALPPVPALDLALLPAVLRARVADCATRASVDPAMVAMPLLAAVSGVIGRGAAIRPRRYSDWRVVPNLWAGVVAPPGALKSPMMVEALDPIDQLEAAARAEHESATLADAGAAIVAAAEIAEAKRQLAKLARKGLDGITASEMGILGQRINQLETREVPRLRRYRVVDATVEALGEVLRDNPRGITCVRDELAGWVAGLDRKGREGDRAFYLTSWAGDQEATVDRIGRGTVRVPATVAMVGTTQPGPLARLVSEARGGVGADGLLQRWQLLVHVDPVEYRPADRWPDHEAKRAVREVFAAIARADYSARGGAVDEFSSIPTFSFADDAQAKFDAWHDALEHRLRAWDGEDALLAHLSKYRSLVPSLALVHHLVEHAGGDGPIPPVSLAAVEAAIGLAGYLEAHAVRIYAAGAAATAESPGALLVRRLADLPSDFTARDVRRKGWAGLSDEVQVDDALDQACARRWIYPVYCPSPRVGGRPTTRYYRNPLPPLAEAPAAPPLSAVETAMAVNEISRDLDPTACWLAPDKFAPGLVRLRYGRPTDREAAITEDMTAGLDREAVEREVKAFLAAAWAAAEAHAAALATAPPPASAYPPPPGVA